ncbi:MAG: hypothetical protein KDA77_09460 [Planctomycetaceae bacterium]|nr:hypothetical protein [Planctomycetaceae bacterium]
MKRTLFLLSVLVFGLSASSLSAQTVKTLAGTGKQGHTGDGGPAVKAMVGEPYGLTLGPDGALYVCEIKSHVIRRVDEKTGKISTVAGSVKKGYSGDGGPALEAELNEPYEVRFDKAGNMYFVEMVNNIVRRVDAETGKISTIAGTGQKGFSGDGGPATEATFSRPHSIALDNNDNLYICDIGNHRIRRVDLNTGIVSTFSGTGERKPTPDGAQVSGTPLNGPRALDFFADGTGKGSLYLALREGNMVYRIDLDNETLHHIAGTGKKGYTGHGGPAKEATLSGPKGISVAPNGDIYLADTESHTIRVIRKKNGIIETAVGDGKKGDGPDGDPAKCRMARPHGVYVGPQGNVYIGDSETYRVRKLTTGQK